MNLPKLDLPETSQNTPLTIYSDASHNHQNGMSFAGLVFANHNGKPIEIRSSDLGKGFGTVGAEVEAATRALKAVGGYGHIKHVKIFCDCKPAVRKLKELNLESMFDQVTFQWIPREENQVADAAAMKGKVSKS